MWWILNLNVIDKVSILVSGLPLAGVLSLALLSWLFYKVFLRRLSEERHKIFKHQFTGLITWSILCSLFFVIHQTLVSYKPLVEVAPEISIYSGFLVIILGSSTLIKTFKILAFEFFFFNSMRAGVPLLLVNVISLLLSLIIYGWLLTDLFNIQLTSILTTSAVLTIVLGLALQDTLGNLFAAISLQIDKPFELDDWIELKNGSDLISGQVKELSWRSTTLLAVTDEYITLPNRMIAQWQIVNFSARQRPFYRGYYFRVPYEASLDLVKKTLQKALTQIEDILTRPAPLIVVTEASDSWVMLKVVYAIKDYGQQYVIADKFFEVALSELQKQGVKLAPKKIQIESRFNAQESYETI